MRRTSGWLLTGLILAGIADRRVHALAATQDQMVREHVRTSSTTIATLIQHATERSHTFRDLLQTISTSDGIVYVEEGVCGGGKRSCFVNVTKAGPNRMLWVMLYTRGDDCDLMGLIGHELQHTIEVLRHPQVTDSATMYLFYAQEADNPAGSNPFETIAAERAGETVRAEVRRSSRCTKIH
jgi:hypothetical protein